MQRYQIVSLALVILLGCGTPPAQAQVPILASTTWVADHLQDENLLILHVTTPRQTEGIEYIPGARPIDYSSIAVRANDLMVELPAVDDLVQVFREAGLSNMNHVVVYGTSSAHLTARIFMTLEYLGHRGKVGIMDGGLEMWKLEGRETTMEAGDGPTGTFEAQISDDVVISTDFLATQLENPTYALIDARPADQYSAGFIPGSANIFWGELMVSEEEPRLIDLDDVRERFQNAGAEEGSLVVSYCAIGMRASYNYLISRLLGYETRIYDGSWDAWSKRQDLPKSSMD